MSFSNPYRQSQTHKVNMNYAWFSLNIFVIIINQFSRTQKHTQQRRRQKWIRKRKSFIMSLSNPYRQSQTHKVDMSKRTWLGNDLHITGLLRHQLHGRAGSGLSISGPSDRPLMRGEGGWGWRREARMRLMGCFDTEAWESSCFFFFLFPSTLYWEKLCTSVC